MLLIGTQFSILYTSVYSPAGAAILQHCYNHQLKLQKKSFLTIMCDAFSCMSLTAPSAMLLLENGGREDSCQREGVREGGGA